MTIDPSLAELADLYGVQTAYDDVRGEKQHASVETLRAILACLGADVGAPGGAAAAAEARRRGRCEALTEPVHVAWGSEAPAIAVQLPHGAAGRAVATLTLEDGSTREAAATLDSLEVFRDESASGERFMTRHLRFDGPVPHGYHEVRVEAGGRSATSTLLAAPVRAYAPAGDRQWGLFAPTYALGRDGGTGVGDLGDLAALVERNSALGGSLVGTLPLLASFLGSHGNPPRALGAAPTIVGPCEWSPYSPASRLFWNDLFLDWRTLPELATCEQAKALIASDGFAETARELRADRTVDYPRQAALRRRVFEALAAHIHSGRAPALHAELEAYVSKRPALTDYAAFRATVERTGASWHEWSPTARGGQLGPDDYDLTALRYHQYVQWRTDGQLRQIGEQARRGGGGLYLDLPLGVHCDGYDIWRHRGCFLDGASAGAPPDRLFSGGQVWGLPPLHPEGLRRDGYRYLRACIRHQIGPAGLLRIDHVMGLHRIYTVPSGASATDGVYLRYRPDELYAVLTIESQRARCALIGEDLGTVPDAVREAMDRHRLHRMVVAQMDAAPGGPPALTQAPAGSIASVNTHDMPSFAGFLAGADITVTAELGLLDETGAEAERAHRQGARASLEGLARGPLRAHAAGEAGADSDRAQLATYGTVVRHLAMSDARYLVLDLEDLWLEPAPKNVPGTHREQPNWRRKLARSVQDGLEDPAARALLDDVRVARRRPARAAAGVAKGIGEGSGEGIGEGRSEDTGLGEVDLHLLNEGTHERLFACLGAHPAGAEDPRGTRFAVWAPAAQRVSVVGDFNGWRPDADPLAPRGGSGVWEGWAPAARHGDLYKLHVVGEDGVGRDKADPLGLRQELPPRTASVIWDGSYQWSDAAWMAAREERHRPEAPLSIYEVHLGSWLRAPDGRHLGYREAALALADHALDLGFTHVELLPVGEHPFYGSWGYQVTGYFAPTARYGTPQDLMAMVDVLHQHGIGVIVDWVPAHFPHDAHGLYCFDGTNLYGHADPRRGFHPDWNTAIFNYGRLEVRAFLLSSAMAWLERYHVDGLRVDGVASMLYLDYSRAEGEWIPNRHGGRENLEAVSFLQQLNTAVGRSFPDALVIAEESTAWTGVTRPADAGGLGFDLKWDLGWMHDTLAYMGEDPLHRKHHHQRLTFRSLYAGTERWVLPLSHDEVVHGKGSLYGRMAGDEQHRLASLRLLYAYQLACPGRPLLFMGAELGTASEWNHDAALDWGLLGDPQRRGLATLVAAVHRLYRDEPALHALDDDAARGLGWIEADDSDRSVIAFERRAGEGHPAVLCALNFTPVPRVDLPFGVEVDGRWTEILNTDADVFGGGGTGNQGARVTEPTPSHGRPHTLRVTLPPLAAVFLRAPA